MHINLNAWFYDSPIDIKSIAKSFPDATAEPGDSILLALDGDKFISVFSFGCVVYWPFDERVSQRLESEIAPQLAQYNRVEKVEDQLLIETGAGQARVLFDKVMLPGEPRRDDVLVISQLLARSVALEYLELQVDDALERFRPSIEELRDRGKVAVGTKSILRSIGFAMDTRQAVLSRLALLDKPDATWEDEQLETMYLKLYDFFELEDRQESIGLKLDFLADTTSMLFDFLSTRKGLRLEWIIIVLIALELMAFLYELSR